MREELKQKGKGFLVEFEASQIDDLSKWVGQFPLKGRTPNGMKSYKENLLFIQNQCKCFKDFGHISDMPLSNINATLLRWSDDDIDSMVDGFNKGKKKVTEVTLPGIVVTNESSLAEAKFVKLAKQIDSYLKGFKGFHAKSLDNGINIVIKKASELRSKARYDSANDQLLIRSNVPLEGDAYGSLLYIVAHELGHRYEKLHGRPEGFWDNGYRTTRYSYTESLSGSSEAFAELFAITHRPSKYPEYKDQIQKFAKLFDGLHLNHSTEELSI